MTTLLRFKLLWSITVKGFNKPENKDKLLEANKQKLEANTMTDAKALFKIQNAISPTIFSF